MNKNREKYEECVETNFSFLLSSCFVYFRNKFVAISHIEKCHTDNILSNIQTFPYTRTFPYMLYCTLIFILPYFLPFTYSFIYIYLSLDLHSSLSDSCMNA